MRAPDWCKAPTVPTTAPRSQVDCALRLYVLHNAYRIARPRDLLAALQPFLPDAEQKLEAYGAHF